MDWDTRYCPSCHRTAYVPEGAYCQFCERYLILMATTVKRAASFAPGIGLSLDDKNEGILGKDVVVTKAWIGERNYDGEMRPIVILTLDNGSVYHAWSKSLADKIAEVPEDEFPLTFKFVKLPTRRPGQTVISFE